LVIGAIFSAFFNFLILITSAWCAFTFFTQEFSILTVSAMSLTIYIFVLIFVIILNFFILKAFKKKINEPNIDIVYVLLIIFFYGIFGILAYVYWMKDTKNSITNN
jgi:hypothetical protein